MLRIAVSLLVVFVLADIGLAGAYYWKNNSVAQTVSAASPHDDNAVVAKRLRAERATGKLNISATWSALDSPAYPTECGITPTDRYYVTQNGIGKTMHDEPTEDEWVQVGCERTSPVHQDEILQQAEVLREQRAAAKANREAAEVSSLIRTVKQSNAEREAEASESERKRIERQKAIDCWTAAAGEDSNLYAMTQEQVDAAKAKCGMSNPQMP